MMYEVHTSQHRPPPPPPRALPRDPAAHRTAGDGVIDSNDGVDTNGDGVIDSNDGATAISATPAPLSDADAEASGNGAMSTVSLPAGSVYAGVVGLAAVTVGGVLLL